MSGPGLLTVVETPAFVAAAARYMSAKEREGAIDFLARRPKAGALIRGTGGVRKLRWAAGSQGKSGGVRIIYYFHSDEVPLFLLTAYPKSRKSDLSQTEKNTMRQVIRDLLASYRQAH